MRFAEGTSVSIGKTGSIHGLRLVHRFRVSKSHWMPDGEDVCDVCIYPRSWHRAVEV